MRVLVWNAQWAQAGRRRGEAVRDVLERVNADVIVLTEGSKALLPVGGSIIEGGSYWGYSVTDPRRRKVLLWSRNEWFDVDVFGDSDLPPGRWVSGRTTSDVGPVDVVGVCVPWRGAHVSTGRRDREVWQEHLSYLHVLAQLVGRRLRRPTVLAGDFNQRIPRQGQPFRVAEALSEALAGFELVTAGEVDGYRLIDHVGVRDLYPNGSPSILRRVVDGFELSDHDGVVVDLSLATGD